MHAGMLENGPVEAFFLDGGRGRLFALFFPAPGTPRGRLLCIPPFAEEANRCRAMTSLGARAFAQAGWQTLLLDPYGCGDSEGRFEEAAWEDWQADIEAGIAWLRDAPGPLGLWGVRLSAVQLAAIAARRRDDVDRLLFWQAVAGGKPFFTQYLRLRVAISLDTFGRQETTGELRERLAGGEMLEVGGYDITPRLARSLDAADYPPPEALSGLRVDWIERVSEGRDAPAPGTRKRLDAWRAAGVDVRFHGFSGPPFWQLHERFTAPDLIERSVRALEDGET